MRYDVKQTLLLIGIVLSCTTPVHAVDVRQVEVTGPRISLGDVLSDAPETLRSVDLGPVPAPGGSRVVSKDEIERVLPRSSHVHVPDAVRVVRKMRVLVAAELERVARQALGAALPPGVTVTALHGPASAAVVSGFTQVKATVPKLAHHAGATSVTVLLDFRRDTEVLQFVSFRVDLDVSAEAALPDVVHGAQLSAIVKRGLVEVSASASASADGDVGDVIPISIRSTGRTLRARIESKERALVVETQ